MHRLRYRIAALFLASGTAVLAQVQSTPAATRPEDPASQAAAADGTSTVDTPLPDVVAMMLDVEQNQRKAETIEKDYIYHSVETQEKTGSLGEVKKTTVTEYDHYWSEGVPVSRMVRRDGRDLSTGELAKEDGRIRNEVEKARERRAKADAEGKATNARGDDLIPVSRLLELGRFSNPRRVKVDGRDTIAVDYAGDPDAKTRNRAEEVIRDLRGTAWIDENDRILVRAEGQFVNGFKIGAGLLISIQKGTHFEMQQTRINDEVWAPAHIEAEGAARALLFFNFSGRVREDYSGYRKLRTSSVLLPGTTKVEDSEAPPTGP